MTTPRKSIKKDYLSGVEDLKPFYHYPIDKAIDFRQVVADKKFPEENRRTLVASLREQYKGIEITEATSQNIDSLSLPNTYTLTAGHQLNLFGGPMYTPYKVMTVIKLAEQLNREIPEHNFVPVFWIHTEDHDFEEINHYYPTFSEKKAYSAPFTGATGDHTLTAEITDLIPSHFPENLKTTYQPGMSLEEATLRFNNELFGEYGLVILNANQASLKGVFKDIIKEELTQKSSQSAIDTSSQNLEAAGYKLQITTREINLFYLDEHGRDRIVVENGVYSAIGRSETWNLQEMMELLDNHPERFSPNVSLRPLYQECILPNLLYTGGWGELSYWMQLKGMFEHYQINFPVLLPRMAGIFFPGESLEQWEEIGFSPTEIQQPLHTLYQAYMPNIWEDTEFQQLSTELEGAFDSLSTYLESISQTLPNSSIGQKVKTQRYLKNLHKKIHRIKRNNHRPPFAKIETLKNQVQPDGLVQERILGLGSFPMESPQKLISEIYKACNPLHFEVVAYK